MQLHNIRKLIEENGGCLNFTNTLQPRFQKPPTAIWYISIMGETQKIWKQMKRDGYAILFLYLSDIKYRFLVNKIFAPLNPIWKENSFQCSITLECMYNGSIYICNNCNKSFKHNNGLEKHQQKCI